MPSPTETRRLIATESHTFSGTNTFSGTVIASSTVRLTGLITTSSGTAGDLLIVSGAAHAQLVAVGT